MPWDLLQRCMEAHRLGDDFQTVWQNILRIDPLIAGPAIDMAEGGKSWVEVPLITGQHLALDAEGYRLISRLDVVRRGSPGTPSSCV